VGHEKDRWDSACERVIGPRNAALAIRIVLYTLIAIEEDQASGDERKEGNSCHNGNKAVAIGEPANRSEGQSPNAPPPRSM